MCKIWQIRSRAVRLQASVAAVEFAIAAEASAPEVELALASNSVGAVAAVAFEFAAVLEAVAPAEESAPGKSQQSARNDRADIHNGT